MAKIPLHPVHPERVCWGCDKYCSADALDCGNGTVRTQHPVEIFGEDWLEWGVERSGKSAVHQAGNSADLTQIGVAER